MHIIFLEGCLNVEKSIKNTRENIEANSQPDALFDLCIKTEDVKVRMETGEYEEILDHPEYIEIKSEVNETGR